MDVQWKMGAAKNDVDEVEAQEMVRSGCVPDGSILALARTVVKLHRQNRELAAARDAARTGCAEAMRAIGAEARVEPAELLTILKALVGTVEMPEPTDPVLPEPDDATVRRVSRNARYMHGFRPPPLRPWACVEAGADWDAKRVLARTPGAAAIVFAQEHGGGQSDGEADTAERPEVVDVFVLDPQSGATTFHRVHEVYLPKYAELAPGDPDEEDIAAGPRPEAPSDDDREALDVLADELRREEAPTAPPEASEEEATSYLARPDAEPRAARFARAVLSLHERHVAFSEGMTRLLLRCHAAAVGGLEMESGDVTVIAAHTAAALHWNQEVADHALRANTGVALACTRLIGFAHNMVAYLGGRTAPPDAAEREAVRAEGGSWLVLHGDANEARATVLATEADWDGWCAADRGPAHYCPRNEEGKFRRWPAGAAGVAP